MVASQLSIYNEALILCEERTLASLSEARKPRYLLDQVWNDGGVNACIEEALWTFATRTITASFDPNINPPSGYIHAFKKPDDYVRTAGIASDPYFNAPLTQFNDEAGYWWADLATLYVKIISKDAQYGNNMTLWPESFRNFVHAHFASKIVGSLTHTERILKKVQDAREKTLTTARGKDAMNEPPSFFPRGQLTRARQGLYFGRPNRGGSGWY